MSCNINHHAGKNFDLTFFTLNPYKWYCCILNLVCKLDCYVCAFLCKDFSCRRINNSFSELMSYNTFIKMKFLIKFITADLGKVISSRIEEHSHDKTLCTLYCKRLTRTDLLIQFKKTFLIIGRCILGKTCKDLRLFTE